MPARRVVVTGAGVLSPVGNDRETFFSTLMAGKSGIRRLESAFVDALDTRIAAWIPDFDPLAHMPKSKAGAMDRVTQLAVVASQQAIADASLDLASMDRERVGVYLGTGMGGSSSIEEGYVRLYRDNASRLKPFTVLMAMNNAAGSQVALEFGLTGPDLTFCTACSSSAVAIGEAARQIVGGTARWIRHDQRDRLVGPGVGRLGRSRHEGHQRSACQRAGSIEGRHVIVSLRLAGGDVAGGHAGKCSRTSDPLPIHSVLHR